MTTGQRTRRPGPPGNASARLTKAQRREQARLERHRLQKLVRRRRIRRSSLAVAMAAVVAAVLAVAVLRPGGSRERPRQAGRLPGVLATEAPWPANASDLPARLAILGLPPEGTAMHLHSHLDLYVNGVHEPVPGGAGIGESEVAPIHTHDGSGIIHVESAEARSFTLGELFDVWGVRLTSECVGGYCQSSASKLWVFVDGKPEFANPRSIELRDHREIVLAYGTEGSLPNPIPGTFDFGGI